MSAFQTLFFCEAPTKVPRKNDSQVRILLRHLGDGKHALSAISFGDKLVFFSSPDKMEKNERTTDCDFTLDVCSGPNSRTIHSEVRTGLNCFTGTTQSKPKDWDSRWHETYFRCESLKALLEKLQVTNDAIGVRYTVPKPTHLFDMYETVCKIDSDSSSFPKLGNLVRLNKFDFSSL